MSNNWSEDILTMIQLSQYDIDHGTQYTKIIKLDKAEDHPIMLDDSNVLCWKADPFITQLDLHGLIDENYLERHGEAAATDPVFKQLQRMLGCSLEDYCAICHNQQGNEDE